jgi:hypothetical protein
MKKTAIIIFCLFFYTGRLGAVNLVSVDIAPDTRAVLLFDGIVDEYNSVLSDNKKNIIITIPNTLVKESAERFVGRGEIDDIYAKNNDSIAEISIFLENAKGYTAVFLPFSQSIIVDVFNWNQLSKSEDHYRTALLGIEDNIYSTTLSELNEAAKLKNPDAAAILGILLIEAGYYQQAEHLLLLAEILETSIHDTYAGLAYIYQEQNNNNDYQKYSEIFTNLNAQYKINDIEKNPVLREFVNIDSYNYADSLLTEIKKEKSEKSKKDSVLTDNFKELFETDSTKADSSNASSGFDFPWWTEFLIMSVAALFLLIIYRYLKWKNKKISEIKSKKSKSDEFRNELKLSQESLKSKESIAAKKYKQAVQNEKRINELIQQKAIDEKSNSEKLQHIIDKKRAENPPEEIKTSNIPAKKKMHPKIELAMHLAREQQNIKNKSINEILNQDLPADVDKLNDVAKKLGIEKGSLEVKNAIDKISNDSKKVAELTQKFSQFGKNLK